MKSTRCIFLGYTDSVKEYYLWDPTARKVIVSRDVIFIEGEQQKKDDNTFKETITIHIEDEFGKDDSFESEPEHKGQEAERVNDTKLRRSHNQTRKLSWHSDYIMASHDAYRLVTEDGESSTFERALNSP